MQQVLQDNGRQHRKEVPTGYPCSLYNGELFSTIKPIKLYNSINKIRRQIFLIYFFPLLLIIIKNFNFGMHKYCNIQPMSRVNKFL